MVSEILEEAGIDRQHLRAMRRQVLEGLILMCQWQLERMERADAAEAPRKAARPKARRVAVE